ncbi:hypothetical protein [Protaetiibacter intestinalis]|uniref:Uncharacterized protein n=1 Tax=Protaetiibacter intestinalis TaxID=2419774 RepID=A0A387B605_9MICO|nr:hypothetical protein [Protaetiibacter intestinalis]AYF97188.1 hypothetical protein D7I47_02280 [Protaetiibacter intestinalis]
MANLTTLAFRIDVDGTITELHLEGDWRDKAQQIREAIGGGIERISGFLPSADAYVHNAGPYVKGMRLNPYASAIYLDGAGEIYGPVVVVPHQRVTEATDESPWVLVPLPN